MKSVLIFSTCLVLILLLGGYAKTNVRGFDVSHDSQLVMTEFSMSPTCFASSTLISESYGRGGFTPPNMTALYSIEKLHQSHSALFYPRFHVPQMVGWASWIGLSYRRQQPYRNPRRRFRLNKKQRRRLLKHLSTRLLAQNDALSGSLSSMEEV